MSSCEKVPSPLLYCETRPHTEEGRDTLSSSPLPLSLHSRHHNPRAKRANAPLPPSLLLLPLHPPFFIPHQPLLSLFPFLLSGETPQLAPIGCGCCTSFKRARDHRPKRERPNPASYKYKMWTDELQNCLQTTCKSGIALRHIKVAWDQDILKQS